MYYWGWLAYVDGKQIDAGEMGKRILEGADGGAEVKDFLHEFQVSSGAAMLSEQPPRLTGCVRQGDLFDAYLQALAEYLSGRVNLDPPDWTQPAVMLAVPWFALLALPSATISY